MGCKNVQHLTGTLPNRPCSSVACTVGSPALDSEPHKPPQTQSETRPATSVWQGNWFPVGTGPVPQATQ